MNECAKKCLSNSYCCEEKKCRMWIDYQQDLNCTLVATNKKPEMTLQEVAKRLNISLVRVKQIQDKAMAKLQKKTLFLK
jgi:hypothetical protein